MRNQSKAQIEAAEKPRSRRGVKKATLFCGDDHVQQELHKKPITDYSAEHYKNEITILPFQLEGANIGIPRFYAIMYAAFVSLRKIYGEGTVTRWADYLCGFLPSHMFPSNKRRKLQEVLANTWAISHNYIENGPSNSQFSPSYKDDLKKFRAHFILMKDFFRKS